MNNDIKEILEGIKVVIKHYGSLEFDTKELKVLLDYITNLQQIEKDNQKLNSELREENEELKERFDLVCKISEERKNKWLSLNEENENLFNIIKDYKSRNEKALYFIDMDKHISTNWDNLTNKEKDEFISSLLIELENILQGENNGR